MTETTNPNVTPAPERVTVRLSILDPAAAGATHAVFAECSFMTERDPDRVLGVLEVVVREALR